MVFNIIHYSQSPVSFIPHGISLFLNADPQSRDADDTTPMACLVADPGLASHRFRVAHDLTHMSRMDKMLLFSTLLIKRLNSFNVKVADRWFLPQMCLWPGVREINFGYGVSDT